MNQSDMAAARAVALAALQTIQSVVFRKLRFHLPVVNQAPGTGAATGNVIAAAPAAPGAAPGTLAAPQQSSQIGSTPGVEAAVGVVAVASAPIPSTGGSVATNLASATMATRPAPVAATTNTAPAATPATVAAAPKAASSATAVTLLNAAPVTQNPDGSTSVFGSQGNAIENINSSGLLVMADPIATAAAVKLPIWYAPANDANYFANILNNPSIFSTVAGGISVFKIYGALLSFPDATLKSFFAFLAQNNIKLGIEAGPLVAAPGNPDYGIESFAGPGDLVAMLNRIKSLGGTLSYIGWDEPLWFGSITTGAYTVSQLATQVALAAAAAKAVFPNAQIGDIEPVGESNISSAALQAWFTAYAKATGTPLSFFQADIATWTPGWQAALASTITMAHGNTISVGVVINGLDATVATNNGWSTQADANAQLIMSDPALRPDYLIVQSWQTYPSEAGNGSIAGTLASVAADVAASEPAALAVPAVAQYSTAGFLQSVTWTGGAQATQDGSVLRVLSPTGAVVFQTAWSNVQKFVFDPNTATVSLTDLVLTSAAGAVPVWQSQSSSIGVGANGVVAITAPVTSGSSLTVGLSTASQTGFAGSGITNLTKPTLAGTAAANAVVAVQVDGVGAGSTTASSAGLWSLTLGTALTAGGHEIEATVTNSATGTSIQQNTVVTVDTATPAPSTLTLAPGSDSGYPDDDITDVTQPIFMGVADPLTAISIAIDGKTVGSVETSQTGTWSYALNSKLAVGAHSVTATAANVAGTSAAPATMALTIDTAANEAAVTSYDPLFDTAWYLQQYPSVAAAGGNPYTEFNTAGWKLGYSPSPFFSTNYYFNTYPDVLAAQVNPLWHFETYGWLEGRNPAPGENTLALEKTYPNLPATEDPLLAYIQGFEYADAVISAVPAAKLTVGLLHDTGASATDTVTNDPTLAITADPNATVAIAVGSATPGTVTVGSTGSWSFGYAAASLPDGAYVITVTETEPGGPAGSATLGFTLDRTAPIVTGVTVSPAGTVTLGTGSIETILLTMSEPVQVVGKPTLTLNDGGVAAYVSGSGTKSLDFSYTVAAGQTASALGVTGVNLGTAGSVDDSAGNAANFAAAVATLPGPVAVKAAVSPAAVVTQASAVQIAPDTSISLLGTSAATATVIDPGSASPASGSALSVSGSGSGARYGSLTLSGNVTNSGTITTRAASAGGPAILTVGLSGAWTNTGTIDAEAGSTIDISGSLGSSLINAGKMFANGMVFLNAAVSGTGRIVVGAVSGGASTVEVGGAISAGQSIRLNDGTLIIDRLGSFLATVKNFNTNDEIVVKGLTASRADYTNGILSLDGGDAGTMRVNAAAGVTLTGASFVLGHVNGDTVITIGTPAAILHG